MSILNKLFGKKDTTQQPNNNLNPTLTYRFRDASVPPEYHRSYTINVTPKNIEFSVDVYGTILLKQVIAFKKVTYQSFITALLALELKEKKESNSVPPVGGSSECLTVIDTAGKEIKGEIYNGRNTYFSTIFNIITID